MERAIGIAAQLDRIGVRGQTKEDPAQPRLCRAASSAPLTVRFVTGLKQRLDVNLEGRQRLGEAFDRRPARLARRNPLGLVEGGRIKTCTTRKAGRRQAMTLCQRINGLPDLGVAGHTDPDYFGNRVSKVGGSSEASCHHHAGGRKAAP